MLHFLPPFLIASNRNIHFQTSDQRAKKEKKTQVHFRDLTRLLIVVVYDRRFSNKLRNPRFMFVSDINKDVF